MVAEGHQAHFIKVDVSNESEVRQLVNDTIARYGTIDILFNNAGILLVKPIDEMSEEEWDRVMSVNVKSAFLAIKHVVPHMLGVS